MRYADSNELASALNQSNVVRESLVSVLLDTTVALERISQRTGSSSGHFGEWLVAAYGHGSRNE